MLTLHEFLNLYPVYSKTGDLLVQGHLDQQALCVSDTWGPRENQIHGLKTAHSLAIDPQGRNARLVSKDGTSVFSRQLRVLERAHAACRGRVVACL